MPSSKLQDHVSSELSKRFGGLTIRETQRPEWLLSITGRRLELDFFIEELNVAIEVQGTQHYVYTPAFHEDYSAFIDQRDRDDLKKKACDYQGITLIEVFDILSANSALETITQIYLQWLDNEGVLHADRINALIKDIENLISVKPKHFDVKGIIQSCNTLKRLAGDKHERANARIAKAYRYLEKGKKEYQYKLFKTVYQAWCRKHKFTVYPWAEKFVEETGIQPYHASFITWINESVKTLNN